MRLALHLFQKDQRVLRWWIVAWIVAQVVYVALDYGVLAQGKTFYGVSFIAPILLLTGPLLIMLLLHQEPLNAGIDFWKTRPLRPRQLLLGKALFLGIYLVLVPLFFKVVLLWLLGFQGYMGLALIEWAADCGTVLLVTLGLSAITSSIGQAIRYSIIALIALPVLLALVQFAWEPPSMTWWDFPSVPVLALLIACVVAIGVVINQYLTGRHRRSLVIVAIGTVVGVALTALPLRRDSAPVQLIPSSNERLDALAESLQPELTRLCPLPREDQGIDEQNNRKLIRIERSLPFEDRWLVDQRQSRVEVEGKTLRSESADRLWLHTGFYDRRFRQVLGIDDSRDTLNWEDRELMTIDQRELAALSAGDGTFRSELLLLDREIKVVFRLPLEAGSQFRRGPYRCTLKHVSNTSRALQLEITETIPRRVLTPQWPGIPDEGFADSICLFHRPTQTVVSRSGSSGSAGTRSRTMKRSGTLLSFGSNGSSRFQSSLLAEQNFNASDWEIIAASGNVVATKRIPIEIPHFRLHRDVPQSADELRERLDSIQVEDFESVEAYLWEVWSCWSIPLCVIADSDVHTHRQWFVDKIVDIGDHNTEPYINVSKRLTGHDWNSAAELAIDTLARLVGPADKELILASNAIDFNLFKVIQEHGWQEAALPSMMEQCQNHIPPFSWGMFCFERQPENFDLLVPFAAHYYSSYRKKRVPAAVAATPNFPVQKMFELRWVKSGGRDLKDGLRDLLSVGHPQALRYLHYVVKVRRVYRDQPAALVSYLAEMSDCPTNLVEAEEWIDAHAETAVFDPAKTRYIIPASTSDAP